MNNHEPTPNDLTMKSFSVNKSYSINEINGDLTPEIFEKYIHNHNNKPLKVKGFLKRKNIAQNWDLRYLQNLDNTLRVPTKRFHKNGDIEISNPLLNEYIGEILQYETKTNRHRTEMPPYCHDVPIFHIANQLINDVSGLAKGYFPKWYADEWWKYAQLFVGPSGSLTPLHFDTLLTHNLFFHVHGVKEFFLIPYSDAKYYSRRDWRWFDLDPTEPEVQHRLPVANKIRVILEPGDLLYMPPGTLHCVKSHTASISFNVDFHTKSSVTSSILSAFDGMPRQSVYYNFLIFFGIKLKIPSNIIFKFYKSYLNYIS